MGRLNSSPIMPKASIWVPKIMPWQDIGNTTLAKQPRNIYISWKWVKVQKLAQTAKVLVWSMVRREGQAEFFSHHVSKASIWVPKIMP